MENANPRSTRLSAVLARFDTATRNRPRSERERNAQRGAQTKRLKKQQVSLAPIGGSDVRS